MRTVEIITVGDELLIGQVVDTNSAWMAQQLNERGIVIDRITSVHDDAEQIASALDDACHRVDIVLMTGGLGPTKDDITKNVLCRYFQTELVYRQDIRQHLEQLYAARPDVLNRLTDTQCLFPANAELIWNRVGSAQVMLWRSPSPALPEGRGEVLVASMPGVPYEMMWVMENGLLDRLSTPCPKRSDLGKGCPEGGKGDVVTHRTLQVTGIAESSLAILLEEWESALPATMKLAYLPKDGVIRLRLSGYDCPASEVEAQFARLQTLVADYCFATEDKPVEVLVGERLKAMGRTIATAESCTGGKLAHLLNKHAGSSAFYMGSVVAYDNRVKQEVLGVSAENLQQYGAVSEAVVRQMAEGVRNLLHTDYAIATSGIAGPDGGTAEKPVGTVWVAWATPEGTTAECFHLGRLRDQITDRAATKALIRMLGLLS